MSTKKYITTNENLYYLCRLDRYTPLTAKFISMGTDIVTPFTQSELVAVMLEKFVSSDETIKRGFHSIGSAMPRLDIIGYEHYKRADNNHSIYWKNSFVHAIGRPVTFWNLDNDWESILEEAFDIDPKISSVFIRSFLFDIIEEDSKFVEMLSNHNDIDFMHWLDAQRQELPPPPDENNYSHEKTEEYFHAIEEMIINPLSKTSKFNNDVKMLLCRFLSSKELDARLEERLVDFIISDVFPKNEKADGYIKNTYRTLIPSDAMRGAIYVGNIVQVLEDHNSGKSLLAKEDIVVPSSNYPSEMKKAMQSDWLTDGIYEDLKFNIKSKYPQLSAIDIMNTGYDFETECDAIVNYPDLEIWDNLVSESLELLQSPDFERN